MRRADTGGHESSRAGSPWFGDLPEGWEAVKCKRLFKEVDERSTAGSEELLSVSHITGVTPRSEKNVTMFQSESLVGYKLCHVGDIAANTMWMWQGAIGVSSHFGVISPSYNVYRQRAAQYLPQYLDKLLRHPRLVDEYYSLSTGIQPSRQRLYPDKFFSILFPLPPLPVQRRIVSFLDEKTAAMARLAEIWKKEIGELEELKKAIIHRAVTRGAGGAEREGTCPHAPNGTADEGIHSPAFGEWKATRLSAIGTFSKGGGISRNELQESGFPAILYGDIYTKYNYCAWEIANHISEKTANLSVKIQTGDILMTGSGETKEDIGKTIVFMDKEAYIGGDVILFRQTGNDSRFLSYALNDEAAKEFRFKAAKGDIIVHIYANSLKNLEVLLPPLPVQREIAAYLDEKCAAIDKAIAGKRKSLEELGALKSRIIADAVTGRMAVS